MKPKTKYNLKLTGATTLTIFSLMVSFVSAYAWFTSVRKIDNGANGFQVTNIHDYLESIKIFPEVKYEDKGTHENYIYQSTPSAIYTPSTNWTSSDTSIETVTDALQLGVYNSLDTNHSALMLIEIKDSIVDEDLKNLSLKFDTKTPYSDKDTGSLLAVKTTETTSGVNYSVVREISKDNNPMSSIIHFSSMTFANDADLNQHAASLDGASYDFKTTYTSTSDPVEKTGFFEMNSSTGLYVAGSYTENISLLEKDENRTTSIKYIAVVVEYYTEALEYIYSINLGNEVLDTESNIDFQCDWSMVI